MNEQADEIQLIVLGLWTTWGLLWLSEFSGTRVLLLPGTPMPRTNMAQPEGFTESESQKILGDFQVSPPIQCTRHLQNLPVNFLPI